MPKLTNQQAYQVVLDFLQEPQQDRPAEFVAAAKELNDFLNVNSANRHALLAMYAAACMAIDPMFDEMISYAADRYIESDVLATRIAAARLLAETDPIAV